MTKVDFYKKWILFVVLGAALLALARYIPEGQWVLAAALLCYIALSGWLLGSSYRTFKRMREHLYSQSHEDQLTGVKNRRYLQERMKELLARYERSGEGFSVVLFDLDNFKDCNSQFGHTAGDKLLQDAAAFLQKCTREHEPLGRYGGDEFVLLLPDGTLKEARETAKRIRKELEQHRFTIRDQQLSLTISSGVAACPEDGVEIEELLNVADEDLYRRKEIRSHSDGSTDLSSPVSDLYPPLMVNDADYFMDEVGKQTTRLYLLAKSGSLEVIKQTIVADKVFRLWGEKDLFEFYYLLEGEILHPDEGKTLTPGTSIIVNNLSEEKYFKTKTDCTLLYVTTTPVFEDQQKQIEELLTLSRKVQIKDRMTEEHCTRLQKLSRRTGERLGLKEEQLFALDYASFLHDIGKSKIPAPILRKPGKLTPEEWELMKQHPGWGRDLILEHLRRSFFEAVAHIVYQHHERYDGKGYPRGLAGDEILVEAQILAVVDTYDAMTTDRPYRKALDRQVALDEIKQNSGSQFSPQAVEAFLAVEEEEFHCAPNE